MVAVALPANLGTRVQPSLHGWGTCQGQCIELGLGICSMQVVILPWAVWVALGDTESGFVTGWRIGTGPRCWVLLSILSDVQGPVLRALLCSSPSRDCLLGFR